MSDEAGFGRQWVLEQLRSLASEANVRLDSAVWQTDADDLRRTPETTKLVATFAAKRFVEVFALADLEDLRQDSGIQHSVRARLKDLVTRARAG